MTKVLFIVGSKRKGSFNRQLSVMAKDVLEGSGADVVYLDPASVPLMDQDIEFPAPDSVAAARKAFSEADVIWIFTPEYNHGIPGAVKNLLDWMSRPLDPADPDRVSAAKGKKVILTGAGGGKKTIFCRTALKEILEFIGMEVIDGEGRGFALDRRAFSEGIWEPGDDVISELREQAELVKKAAEGSQRSPPPSSV
jgi:NAD(P)H-dependent FMN reductase